MKINIKRNAKDFTVKHPTQRSDWVFIMPSLAPRKPRPGELSWLERLGERVGLHF